MKSTRKVESVSVSKNGIFGVLRRLLGGGGGIAHEKGRKWLRGAKNGLKTAKMPMQELKGVGFATPERRFYTKKRKKVW